MGYIERQSRDQMLLLPASVDDYVVGLCCTTGARHENVFTVDLGSGERMVENVR
jgi:transposase